ncbi:CobW_C [Seminavis robusta]|uniref:CobW_C n=1 Tax=Seminavis robusta TaxID=568900 RepID=A0A9N8HEP6_9STRA|nr:CobW_C [Seminavis robusta]|eukprot:Sro313_g114840.1 CobW_C (351) ;mRNA; f:42151-43542
MMKQIIDLATEGIFDYMIIEASGVSEPAQIAQLFAEVCNQEHDHEQEHDAVLLGELARLDTCIEYANVILLNKTDLVLPHQLKTIRQRVKLLNPKAKKQTVVPPSCCNKSQAAGKAPCCGSNRQDSSSTGKSQIILGSSIDNTRESKTKRPKTTTRHEARFGVSSFLYLSRLPFHPKNDGMTNSLKSTFIMPPEDDEDAEDEEFDDEEDEGEQRMDVDDEKDNAPTTTEQPAIDEATKKTKEERAQELQEELEERLKRYSQAGSMVTIEDGVVWDVLQKGAWDGGDPTKKEGLRKNWQAPYGDRRQELVFIGVGCKIQKVLDGCLMTEDEYDMGVDGWKATMGDALLSDR